VELWLVDCEACMSRQGCVCEPDETDIPEDYDPYAHDCVITETPDGMGCPTCLYG